jgi:hypothetical protein
MKYWAVLLVVIVVVVAAAGLYIFYETQNDKKSPTGSHIYLGAVYSGQTKDVNYISASVDFNNGANLKNTIYYAVLSAWDNNKSYDQIGVASLYGNFYSTYSYTTMLNGTIQYLYPHKGWFSISPGEHSFSVSATNGNVTFTFNNKSYTAHTGGSYFTLSSNEIIGNHSYAGLTIYEEVYGFNKTLPSISYNFTDVKFGSPGNPPGYVSSWMQFSHNISAANYTSYVYMKSDAVNIYNAPSLTLKLDVQNLSSSATLTVSDMNITIPGNGQYSFNLIKGNYTVYLTFSNQTKTFQISLTSDVGYTIRA